MINTFRKYLNGVAHEMTRTAIMHALDSTVNLASSACLTSAGLATDTAKVKTGGSTTYLIVNKVLTSIASATDFPALVGSVPNAQYGVFCFYCDQNGVGYTLAGSPATTLAGIVFPATPLNQALVGFVIINPTGTGPFIGGTTSLTDGTVVPGAVFVNMTGDVDPTIAVK